MGSAASREPRRISFDNTFSVLPPSVLTKSADDLDLNALAVKKRDDLIFPETKKLLENERNDEVDYWAKRIDHLKKEHRMINQIIETEYEKTLKKNTKLMDRSKDPQPPLEKVKTCFECRKKIQQCYEKNRHQSLVCSPLVQAFKECVTTCRSQDSQPE